MVLIIGKKEGDIPKIIQRTQNEFLLGKIILLHPKIIDDSLTSHK